MARNELSLFIKITSFIFLKCKSPVRIFAPNFLAVAQAVEEQQHGAACGCCCSFCFDMFFMLSHQFSIVSYFG